MNRTIALPEDLLKKAEALATLERQSLEEFLTTKLAEQFAGLEYLQRRAARADVGKFRAALEHIPDVEPEEQDRF